MKDDMVLMLSKGAVDRLIKDDAELEVKLKQCVVNALVNNTIKITTDDLTYDVRKAFKKEFEALADEIMTDKGWDGLHLTKKGKNAIQTEFNSLFRTDASKAFKEASEQYLNLIESYKKKAQEKLNEWISMIDKWNEPVLDDALINRISERVLEKMQARMAGD